MDDSLPTRSDRPHPYQQTIDAVIAALDTEPHRGLDGDDARARLERDGPNELTAEAPAPAWKKLLAQFQNVLVILLLVATAISAGVWLYEGASALPYEAMAICAVVLLNAGIGFVLESRAESAVAALRQMAAAHARVIRDGEPKNVLASEVVAGDILLIEEGDTVAADARVIQSTGLQTAEAPLTGESMPVPKEIAAIPDEVALGDRYNMIFGGTTATYGRGRAVVVATGMRTEMGRIAGMLRDVPDDTTPLQKELDRVGKLLGVVVVVIAVVMVATILLLEEVSGFSAIFNVLILGVALAVAAVPEGMPTVVTAVLAIGVQRMARKHAIVRHLHAVETLGSAAVIASDKTGTLTKNEMTVRAVVTASGQVELSGTGYAPQGEVVLEGGGAPGGALRIELERVLAIARCANNAVLQERNGRWAVQGDPTEGALVVAARKAGLNDDALELRFKRVAEVPFSESLVLPLLATQLLWINLVTDGAPALALGLDPAEPGLMDRPPRARDEGVITRQMWAGIFVVGVIMAAGTLFMLDASLPGGFVEGTGDLRHAQTMAFTTLMLFQLFNVFNARSDGSSAFSGLFSNRWLWISVGFRSASARSLLRCRRDATCHVSPGNG